LSAHDVNVDSLTKNPMIAYFIRTLWGIC